jgi:hypothetical protein
MQKYKHISGAAVNAIKFDFNMFEVDNSLFPMVKKDSVEISRGPFAGKTMAMLLVPAIVDGETELFVVSDGFYIVEIEPGNYDTWQPEEFEAEFRLVSE